MRNLTIFAKGMQLYNEVQSVTVKPTLPLTCFFLIEGTTVTQKRQPRIVWLYSIPTVISRLNILCSRNRAIQRLPGGDQWRS